MTTGVLGLIPLLVLGQALASGDAVSSINGSLHTLVETFQKVGLSVATIVLLYGGFKYMVARGNPVAMDRAKGTMEHAAIGYGIVILASVLGDLLQAAIKVQ